MNVSIKFIGGIKLKSLSEKIYMELEMPGEYNTIGDKDRIIEVIQNVMENAIKYGDGKEIKIDFSEEENCKLVSIFNTGYGLKQ